LLGPFCFASPQPLFFVASQNHVRVYNLVKQQLVRKLLGGAGRFTSLALHPTGDHVLTGAVPNLCPLPACSCLLRVTLAAQISVPNTFFLLRGLGL
jgi:hypothetical protein